MLKTVISDTSCFIVLSKINRLELLRELYGKVYTTSVISEIKNTDFRISAELELLTLQQAKEI